MQLQGLRLGREPFSVFLTLEFTFTLKTIYLLTTSVNAKYYHFIIKYPYIPTIDRLLVCFFNSKSCTCQSILKLLCLIPSMEFWENKWPKFEIFGKREQSESLRKSGGADNGTYKRVKTGNENGFRGPANCPQTSIILKLGVCFLDVILQNKLEEYPRCQIKETQRTRLREIQSLSSFEATTRRSWGHLKVSELVY